MGIAGGWIQVIGCVGVLSLCVCSPVFGEEESRLQEILDVLESISQNLKDAKYGLLPLTLTTCTRYLKIKRVLGYWRVL
jgi:hypothetical protein